VGLFGSIFKGIGKAVGGIAKIGVGALRSGLIPLPLGGVAGGILGRALLHSKAPMGQNQLKLQIPPLTVRGKTYRPVVKIGSTSVPTLTALRRSPVMPGGAVATRTGVAPRPLTGAAPLGTTGGGTKRRRRKAGASTRRKSRSSSTRKRGRSRRLKFGSPAWRKKYLGHGRKRGRRKSRKR
jgi:hypothetical protein